MIKLGLYKYYKGGIFKILDFAQDTKSNEAMVVYQALQASDKYPEGKKWVRSVEEFLEEVSIGVDRFKYIGENKNDYKHS